MHIKTMALFLLLGSTIFSTSAAVWQGQPASTAQQMVMAQTIPVATPCWPTALPAGAITGQPDPVFCSIVNSGPDTSNTEENRWVDGFQHGLSFANFDGTAYRIFNNLDVYQTIHWRHAFHWMVDIAPESEENATSNNAIGGAMLRPDRTFRFQGGDFTVDTDFAAGIAAYNPDAWGEIIISTGDHPVYNALSTGEPTRQDKLYGYDLFPNHWTLGCRFQADGTTICSLMNPNTLSVNNGGRNWEISFFQIVGEHSAGGFSDGTIYRFCGTGDPDMVCRDRFRLALTRTSLTIYANGIKFFEQTGLPPLPDEFIEADLYVYLASIIVGSSADTVRFHWDQFVINSDEAPSAAPGFTSLLPHHVYLPLVN